MTVAFAVAVIATPVFLAVRWWRARREELDRVRSARELPAAVSDMARVIRSGATFDLALRDVAAGARGRLGHELRAAVSLLELGHGFDRMLRTWGRATKVDGVDLVVAACRFSLAHGDGLASALDGVSSTLCDRVEVSDEVAALASQARASTAVLTALPLVGSATFAIIDPGYLSVLRSTATGRVCLLVGTCLLLFGTHLSRSLVKRAVGIRGAQST